LRMGTLPMLIGGGMLPLESLRIMTSILFVYSAFVTLFYLLYGISFRRLHGVLPESTDIMHIVAMVLSSVIVVLEMPFLFYIISLGTILYMLAMMHSDYSDHNASKGGRKRQPALPRFYTVYLFLILLFSLNIIDILVPDFLRAVQLIIYLASTALFLAILYKVTRILDVHSKGGKGR
jgi:hypothetical protein